MNQQLIQKNLAAYIRVFVVIAMYPCIRLVRSFMEKHGASKEMVTTVYLGGIVLTLLLVIVSLRDLSGEKETDVTEEKKAETENDQKRKRFAKTAGTVRTLVFAVTYTLVNGLVVPFLLEHVSSGMFLLSMVLVLLPYIMFGWGLNRFLYWFEDRIICEEKTGGEENDQSN